MFTSKLYYRLLEMQTYIILILFPLGGAYSYPHVIRLHTQETRRNRHQQIIPEHLKVKNLLKYDTVQSMQKKCISNKHKTHRNKSVINKK